MRLDAVAERSTLADDETAEHAHEAADEDRREGERPLQRQLSLEPEQRSGADDDAENAASDRESDANRVRLPEELLREPLDDLGVVVGAAHTS